MANVISIYQAADRNLAFNLKTADNSLTSATEIEVLIDTPTQIIKKLSDGEVTSVTTTSFIVQITDSDTESTPSGEYDVQVRKTSGTGLITQGICSPSTIRIVDSKFTTVE